MKKFIIALAAVVLTVLFLSTFIEQNNTDEDNDEDSIVMSVSNLNLDLDKTKGLSKDDENIICATCRGLVKSNNSNEVVPDLAENIDISKDGIEYKFILKDDIYWSDGEKIKPEEILRYFKSLIKLEDDDNICALLDVYGVKNFKMGKGTFEKDVAITSEGNIIKMRLNKKNDDFLLELSKPQYRIRKDLSLWDDAACNYKNIIYSGEYSISDIYENKIELKRNDNKNKKLILIKDESKEDAMASYEVGDRDIVVDPPISQIARLDKSSRVLSSPSGNGVYLAINSQKLNIDIRKEFVRYLYKGAESYYEENKKLVKFSEGSYFKKDMDELDKLQSRKVSVSSGKDCRLPDKIKILIEDDDIIEDFSRFIKDYFSENEDVNIQVEKRDRKEIDSDEDFDMIIFNGKDDSENKIALYSDMKQFFTNENKRYFEDITKIEENLFNSYSVVPIMFTNRNIVVSDKVSNVRLDGNGNVDFSVIS